jgi:hypothetical protein
MKKNTTGTFPYLVVRWIPGVYGLKEIRFSDKEKTNVFQNNITFYHPSPYSQGKLEPEVVWALVGIIKTLSRNTRICMSLVLGQNEAIFIEPDGETSISDRPPRREVFRLGFLRSTSRA